MRCPRSTLSIRFRVKVFRLWYQAQIPLEGRETGSPAGGRRTGTPATRNKDGIQWTLPDLGLVEFRGNTHNNICFARPGQFSDPRLVRVYGSGISSMRFLNEDDMPEADLRGYKYLMTYSCAAVERRRRTKPRSSSCYGDGIHWDRGVPRKSIVTGAISDGWMSMNYDPDRKKYELLPAA